MFGANRVSKVETVMLNMKVESETKKEFMKIYEEITKGLDYHEKKYDFVVKRLIELYHEFNEELEARIEYGEREEARLETEADHK